MRPITSRPSSVLAPWQAAALALMAAAPGTAAKLVLPQNRNALYCDESVELAVAGLARGEAASIEFEPEGEGASAVWLDVRGDGSTTTVVLPPLSLAPGRYAVRLDGEDAAGLTVASGVRPSTMLLSQTSVGPEQMPEAAGNALVGNAFSFGLLDTDGQPSPDLRRRSAGMDAFDHAIALDLPMLVYMYWTGYVTHKPFGTEKSYVSDDMVGAMRLLSFHTAQRLRRYGRNIVSVGAIDEPGLPWGDTPAGGMASGFPNWNEQAWYEARGWEYTPDIAGQSDADWLQYMGLRTSILRESMEQAKRDLKAVWPDVAFGQDLYALHAIMDGTDTPTQQINDEVTTHVFFDFWGGPLAVTGQLYWEKAHDPLAGIAHAMNGQLEGERGPQRPLYHLLMNAMLMAGLESNWWLNTGGMTQEDLAAVNEPAARLGPLFREFEPRGAEVAILWSCTEMAMRQKAMAALESTRQAGEPVKLTVPLPPDEQPAEGELESNAYEVGVAYARPLIDLHQALRRAGYPTHIVDEGLVSPGILRNYKALFVNGQTFDLPEPVQRALADFRKSGTLIADRSTTATLPDPVVHDLDLNTQTFRQRTLIRERHAAAAKTERERSLFETTKLENEPVREAVPPLKALLAQTKARPVVVGDDVDLVIEKHLAGKGALYMVLNGHEECPEASDDAKLPRYNFTPAITTYRLQGVPRGAAVYAIEGLDWRHVRKLADPTQPETVAFATGEMKLYLVAPRSPKGLELRASAQGNALHVTAHLNGVRMPWPLTVTVTAPGGKTAYHVHRAMDASGSYRESFPVGANAAAGPYAITVESPVGELRAGVHLDFEPTAAEARPVTDAVRVFDEPQIRDFLRAKPKLVIALGNEGQRRFGDALAADLAKRGIGIAVASESEVLRKVRYPRVWSPYATVYSVGGGEVQAPGEVTATLQAGMTDDETVVVDAQGNRLADDAWRQPGAVVTVTADGLTDWLGQDQERCYEPGVLLYVDEQWKVTVLNAEGRRARTAPDFRRRWSRPWGRLQSYVGNFQLPPQLPEAYTTDAHLIMLGNSHSGFGVAALQASELLQQTVDEAYPGPGKALLQFVWSPFAVERNVVFIGASDGQGLLRGTEEFAKLAR